MGIVRLLEYTALPALFGAGASLFYPDMPFAEGARQAVLAGLPTAALLNSSEELSEKTIKRISKHPYLFPVFAAGATACLYYLGSLGMEVLAQQDLNQKFLGIVGGLEGALFGAFGHIICKAEAER